MARKSTEKFEIDLGMSRAQRGAEFLHWFAKKNPGVYVAYNELVQNINGYKRKPLLKSEEVEQMRKSMTAVKRLLFDKHEREIVSLPGVGIRASVDDADKLKNVVTKKAGRLQSARVSFVKTVSTIDQRTIPNTPELVPYKNWLNREVKDLMKQLSSAEFERKLLPPPSEPVAEVADDEESDTLAKSA